MTVLKEFNAVAARNKLYLKRNQTSTASESLKRKCPTDEDLSPQKRQRRQPDMFIGSLTEDNDRPLINYNALGRVRVSSLTNVGNTCFLNSVLYVLRFAPTFVHQLHHLVADLDTVSAYLQRNEVRTLSLDRTSTNSVLGGATGGRSTSTRDLPNECCTMPKPKRQIVVERLHDLYARLHLLEVKEATVSSPPTLFMEAFCDIHKVFEGNRQQDAHEFLLCLLGIIRDTYDVLIQQIQSNPQLYRDHQQLSDISASPSSSSSSPNVKCWSLFSKFKARRKEAAHTNNAAASTASSSPLHRWHEQKAVTNFIADDFEGIVLRRTQCLECEQISVRREPFYNIEVHLPRPDEEDYLLQKDRTPNDIFRTLFMASEKLSGLNRYFCEVCQRYNEATRDVRYNKIPNMLVVQLKRFTSSTFGTKKITTYLPTPFELDCFCEECYSQPELSERHKYHLCGIIMHLSNLVASGHYIAYVKVNSQKSNNSQQQKKSMSDCLYENGGDSSTSVVTEPQQRLSIKNFKFPSYTNSNSISNNINPNSRTMSSGDEKFPTVKNGVRPSGGCKSNTCCTVELNRDFMRNLNTDDELWLECDDDTIKPILRQDLDEILSNRGRTGATPYLLFYAK